MPLPTKGDIKVLEKELGFPFRTAHFTNEDGGGDDTPFYRDEITRADLVHNPARALFVRLARKRISANAVMSKRFIELNNQAEDRYNEQCITYDETL